MTTRTLNKIVNWSIAIIITLTGVSTLLFLLMGIEETYYPVILFLIFFLPIEIYCWWAIAKNKNLWPGGYMGYIIAGSILYFARKNKFVTTTADEIIVLVIAVTAGILYSWIKKRVKFIKNEVLKSVIVAVGLIAISAFLIGGLTSIF